ncbi:MAG: kelch repeat-containing protein [Dehalococcoidia bacterium]
MLSDHLQRRRITRRALLRSAFLGGSGLFAAQMLGCGDNGGDGTAATATRPALDLPGPTSTPAPSPTPQVLRWERLAPSGALPTARRDQSMVSDGKRVYVFGGRNGDAGDLNDLWTFDLKAGTWTEVAAADGPSPRHGHNAAWDTDRGRMVIFGGQQGDAFFNDTWAFEPPGGAWSQLSTGAPTPQPRYGAGAALVPGGLFFVTHGFTDQGRFDDSWQFDFSQDTWTSISPNGDRPIKRCLMRSAWDPGRERLLLFAGQTDGTPFLDDLWALTPNGWQQIDFETGPNARHFYAMVFDDLGNKLVLFGGNSESGPLGDLWYLDALSDTWRQPSAENEGPSPRYGHEAVWVPERRTMYLFGGTDGSNEMNDLWALSVPV